MDQFSAHAVATATNEPKAPASRNRLEGHLCVVGGECWGSASARCMRHTPGFAAWQLPTNPCLNSMHHLGLLLQAPAALWAAASAGSC